MATKLLCPAGLAARASRRSMALAMAALVAALSSVALLTPWGVRGALVALVCAWAVWMAAMPVAVIASARRNGG